jgi:hypothetical protein
LRAASVQWRRYVRHGRMSSLSRRRSARHVEHGKLKGRPARRARQTNKCAGGAHKECERLPLLCSATVHCASVYSSWRRERGTAGGAHIPGAVAAKAGEWTGEDTTRRTAGARTSRCGRGRSGRSGGATRLAGSAAPCTLPRHSARTRPAQHAAAPALVRYGLGKKNHGRQPRACPPLRAWHVTVTAQAAVPMRT